MIKNRMAVNILLACMIAAITLYVSGEREKEKTRQEKEKSNHMILPEAEKKEFSNIEITREGAPKIIVKKNDDGKWRLTAPYNMRADLRPINRLTEIVHEKLYSEYDKDEVDLERLGLFPAKIIIRLDDLSIVIGTETDPLTGRRYILYNDKVYLIEDTFAQFFTFGYPAFVNRLIIPDEAYIEGIETNKFKINRNGDVWETTPRMTLAQVEKLFSNWKKTFSTRVTLISDRKIDINSYVRIDLQGYKEPIFLYLVKTDDELVLISEEYQVEYYLPIRLERELFPNF